MKENCLKALEAAEDERLETRDKGTIQETIHTLRAEKEETDEAHALLKDMQRNFEDAEVES